MTIKELRKFIKWLPPDLDVMIGLPDGSALSACKENSDIVDVEIDGKVEQLLLLVTCSCVSEVIPDEEEFNLN